MACWGQAHEQGCQAEGRDLAFGRTLRQASRVKGVMYCHAALFFIPAHLALSQLGLELVQVLGEPLPHRLHFPAGALPGDFLHGLVKVLHGCCLAPARRAAFALHWLIGRMGQAPYGMRRPSSMLYDSSSEAEARLHL